MPRLCAVSTCPNHKIPNDTVHRFPSLDLLTHKRKTWENFASLASGGSTNIKLDNYGICSKHFKDSDYQENSKRLKYDAIPSYINGKILKPQMPS